MSSSTTRYHVLFRGLLNEYDDDDEEELEFGEVDSRAFALQEELNSLEPNRDPKLEVDYLGINGDIELLFNCKTTWIDRGADMEDYIDKVQETIENGLNMIINEKEFLGYTSS
ncbi:MAG: hypothetical protein ACXAD7_05630 [Candidatus Kariarchaeaceae archaeon]|jgi:hypothetical protein